MRRRGVIQISSKNQFASSYCTFYEIDCAVLTEVFVFARNSATVMERTRFNMIAIVFIENEAIS